MRCRPLCLALAASFAALAFAAPARADLLIRVDKSTQRMTVIEDGRPLYVWPVSTGVARYDTPSGTFQPFRMEKDHFSKEWDDAPMPYSIFFTRQGHAIHGTNHTSIGRAASHGCVRLSVKHAAILWSLVKHEKMANTKVVLFGEVPGARPPAVARAVPPVGTTRPVDMNDVAAAVPPLPPDARDAPRWRETRDGTRYYYIEQPQPSPRTYYRIRRAEPPPVQYDAERYGGDDDDGALFPFSLFGR
jgi:hypothetical protein